MILINKPEVYHGFCPWGHGGTVTVRTSVPLVAQRNYCVHCGMSLVMGSAKEEGYILTGERK